MHNQLNRREFNASVLGFPVTLTERTDGGPMRPITNGRRSIPVGAYYSLKNGVSLPWESRVELHGLYHCEVSPNVISYRVQPHTMQFVIDGVVRSYTPDREEILVVGQPVVTEVKDKFKADKDPLYAEKLEYARMFYRAAGKSFRIQERAEIEACPLFDAIDLIQSFRRTTVTTLDILNMHALFSGRETLPLAEVRDMFKSAPLGLAKLSAMMVRRIIALDLTQRLGPNTPIHILGTKKGDRQ